MDSPLSEVITIIDTFPAFPPAKDLREQIITVILPNHPLTTVTTVPFLCCLPQNECTKAWLRASRLSLVGRVRH